MKIDLDTNREEVKEMKSGLDERCTAGKEINHGKYWTADSRCKTRCTRADMRWERC